MAVEINSGSTGDPSAKSSKPDELLCVALSMDLALSYLHLKLNVGEAGCDDQRMGENTRKRLTSAISSSCKEILALLSDLNTSPQHKELIDWNYATLHASIFPEVSEVRLRQGLEEFERNLLSKGSFPKYQFMPELLIFVTLYSVYKTHIESGEYPMIKSWFQCLDKSDAVFKFMGDSTKIRNLVLGSTHRKTTNFSDRNVMDLSQMYCKPPLPSPDKKNILITSALPYVNNSPHIGNIIGCVLSGDAYAKYCRLRGYNCLHVCGTDEYGTATEFRAIQENVSCKELCDKYFKIHKKIYEWMEIDFDCFGRTSTDNHTILTQQFYEDLKNNNYIVKKSTNQLFCNKHERFLADRFVEGTCPTCSYAEARGDQCDGCGMVLESPISLINPKCKIDGSVPIVKKSDHLYLDLASISPLLKQWVDKISIDGNWSQNTVGITNSWFAKGLEPRCITRDLSWGVPVNEEGYAGKVFYVWFDACIGYLSITADYLGEDWKKWWLNPENVKLYQFMGKDNVNFHTVVFPSMQLGSGRDWTMLHHIDTTEFLLYEDDKFSKSRGVGVFGDDLIDLDISPSVWRYYLLFNRPERSDVRFSWDQFAACNNSELLSDIGNLTSRVLKFAAAKYNSVVPEYSTESPREKSLVAAVNSALKQYNCSFEAVKIRNAAKFALEIASLGNKYLQDCNLSNKLYDSRKEDCSAVIGVSINLIYLLAATLYPFTPGISMDIYKQLNVPPRIIEDEWKCSDIHPGHVIGTPFHLFRHFDQDYIDSLRTKFSSGKKIPSTTTGKFSAPNSSTK